MAISQYYVDYGAGNDTTGDGSIGTPWKTIQKALDTITRNATDGDQINVKAGTAQVLAASLTLATYGTPDDASVLTLRGYTSAANDGGIGEIDCGGFKMWTVNTYNYITMIDLEMHSFGDNHGVSLNVYITLFNCEVHRGASSPVNKFLVRMEGAANRILNCHIHSPGSGILGCVGLYSPSAAIGNYINVGANSVYGIYASDSHISDNAILCNNTGAIGIEAGGYNVVRNNSVRNLAAGTASGIYVNSAYATHISANNIVVGWSGTGGEGILISGNPGLIGYNAFYNNTANYTVGDQIRIDERANDVALAADPFTDAANGDFSLTTAAQAALRSAGWPASYLGAHANTDPHITIGALQYGPTPAASGGVTRRVMRLLGG